MRFLNDLLIGVAPLHSLLLVLSPVLTFLFIRVFSICHDLDTKFRMNGEEVNGGKG